MSGLYHAEFAEALDVLARALWPVRMRGAALPVLVGGAVVEIDTSSAVSTGDFDLQGGAEDEIRQASRTAGFREEDRSRHELGGFFHPNLPIGVELV